MNRKSAWMCLPLLGSLAFHANAQSEFYSNEAPPRPEPVFDESDARSDDRWALYSNYTYSDLSNGRGNWQQMDTEVYYIPNNQWNVMGSASYRNREGESDVVYGVRGSYQVNPRLEVHGGVYVTPDADFTYERGYEIGAEYRAAERLDLLMDVRRYDYQGGNLTEIRPGVRVHATDRTDITARYTSGRAFGERNYDGWSVRMDHEFDNRHRLSATYAQGADPEMLPDTNEVLLSDSETIAVGYRFPIRENVDMTLGVEHESRPGVYNRTGVSAGVVVRF